MQPRPAASGLTLGKEGIQIVSLSVYSVWRGYPMNWRAVKFRGSALPRRKRLSQNNASPGVVKTEEYGVRHHQEVVTAVSYAEFIYVTILRVGRNSWEPHRVARFLAGDAKTFYCESASSWDSTRR